MEVVDMGFDDLEAEKQLNVLNAAFLCFGRGGYKKASMADIAVEAGVSKASLFHYFGTKESLYKRLFTVVCDEILGDFREGTADYFECIQIATEIKLQAMERHPAMYEFMLSLVKETDQAALDALRTSQMDRISQGAALLFKNVDYGMFLEDLDRAVALRMVEWVSNGCVSAYAGKLNKEAVAVELDRCMRVLRQALYKEEFR
jgi:AcrR family transcriptional regulator